ncbi:uncharacterized protein BDV17DRAFT_264651 [Aspergillus undulatus]|uniref:uncharacterized protein n=1 Tax=Aspergillus undulatus TaxID=1810928 RepID=UPI003CCCF026
MGGLYQAYLHSVTTFVLLSATTGRSGTEEALRILRQARTKAPVPLDHGCLRLLELIGTFDSKTPVSSARA